MENVNHKPATPLPWTIEGDEESIELLGADGGCVNTADRGSFGDDFKRIAKDMGYERHAANAYPKLVTLARMAHDSGVDSGDSELSALALAMLLELGEES